MPGNSPPKHSLAYKLDRLFTTLHPAGRGEYTLQEVIDGIRAQGGPTLSAAYLWQLRNGTRDNPRKDHLDALARFFGVNPSYFFDGEAADQYDRDLDLIGAMRDAGVRNIAFKLSLLAADEQRVALNIIEQLGTLRERATEAPPSWDGIERRRGGDRRGGVDDDATGPAETTR